MIETVSIPHRHSRTCQAESRINLMQIARKNTRGALVPFAIAVLIAVLGTAALFVLEFRTRDEVASDGISMVTSAAADRAGATAVPTVDYHAADKNRSSLFRIVR